jgi:hypothetical protein
MRNLQVPLLAALSASFAMLMSSDVQAQDVPLTIDVSENPTDPAPQPRSESTPQYGRAGAEAAAGEGEELDDVYYGDYLGDELDDDNELYEASVGGKRNPGMVPETHTVRSGDTLWDLSSFYFNDAWHWPKVWGLNPEITNPHWIYPGNVVRLRAGGDPLPVDPADGEQAGSSGDDGGTGIVSQAPTKSVGLQRTAYVSVEDLKDAGTVDGAVHDKMLLSAGDSIYVKYEGETPKVGETFAVYSEDRTIKRDGKKAGAYVIIHGTLTITFAQKDKRARAVVNNSLRVIERGMRVGPLEQDFSAVVPVANTAEAEATIVGLIGPDYLIGTQAAVVLDRGSDDGVNVGNRFLVLRRGDAYARVMRPGSSVGQDDENYPARAIGEVLVVQVGKTASLGVVSFSIHEFGVGDRALISENKSAL